MSLLGMILKKKEKPLREEELLEEEDDMSFYNTLVLDAGECFPINLAKGYVEADGRFKISFLLKHARHDGLELFIGFTDETNYDLGKMTLIADFYENLLRKSEYSKLNQHFQEASWALKSLSYDQFHLMRILDCPALDKEHRLYMVTVVERFCELVRYVEMWSEGKKNDYYDVADDSGFLYLAFKYDLPDVFTQEAFDRFFDSEKEQNEEEVYTISVDDDDLFDWDDDDLDYLEDLELDEDLEPEESEEPQKVEA